MKKSIYAYMFFINIIFIFSVQAQQTSKDGVGMNKGENKSSISSSADLLNSVNVDTKFVEEIINTAALCKYTVKLKDPAIFTEQGVCWGKSEKPDILGNKVANSQLIVGESNAEITNLEPSTKYFVRAYVTTTAGTVYGKELSFTTISDAGVSTYWIRRR